MPAVLVNLRPEAVSGPGHDSVNYAFMTIDSGLDVRSSQSTLFGHYAKVRRGSLMLG